MAYGRKTGGRKKGVQNKATLQRKLLAEAGISVALATGTSPLEVILKVMRGGPEAENVSERQYAAACAAAPFVHPRLASTAVFGSITTGELSIEERVKRLAALEAEPPQIEGWAEPVQDEG